MKIDVMFRILGTVALAMYTLLGTSFASGTISLGGLAGSTIPVVDPASKTASALEGANKVSSAKTVDVSNDAAKALWGKSNAFLRFAQDEAYKTHIATVVKRSEKDSWLRDKKFDNSIWAYIPKVFNDAVTGQSKISAEIYDFAPKCSADAYSGANWNALLVRNTVNYAFLLEQNAPELDALKAELEKQTLSDNILGGKYGKLIEFTGAQLGKTEKFNKARHSKAMQAAVCDVKKYFRGCQLERYIDELLKCHRENLLQFDRNSSKPQRCSFPNVQGYFCAGKDEKSDYLENFGYVEFTKPVDIGTGDLHKHDYFVKKRYYRNGIPDTLKVLSNGKKNYVYASRYLGYEHIRYLGGSREDEMFFYCFHMKYRASLRVEERLTTIDRLLCELEKVETEVRELFKRYKGLLSSSWIKERKNDDEWLKKTLNTTLQNQSKYRDVCFIEEKQRILRQDAEIKLYQDWQSKVCNAQIVTTSDILSGKNVDKNKSYFLFGRYDSWFDLSPHEDFLQEILAEETKEAKLALERRSLCPGSIRKLIPKLPEYIKELEVMSKNCEKFPKCGGLSFGIAKKVKVSTTSPDTICTTEEGKAFLLKLLGAQIAELKKYKEIDENSFESNLNAFRNTSQVIIQNNFEDIKRYVKQLLTERNKDIKNAKSKNDSKCIYVSKFAEIDKVPYFRYKDKFPILGAIIKSNAEKLRSLNLRTMEGLRPVLLKKIDEVFVPLKKS